MSARILSFATSLLILSTLERAPPPMIYAAAIRLFSNSARLLCARASVLQALVLTGLPASPLQPAVSCNEWDKSSRVLI